MPTRRFEGEALAQLLVGGCAVAFSACVLIEHATIAEAMRVSGTASDAAELTE